MIKKTIIFISIVYSFTLSPYFASQENHNSPTHLIYFIVGRVTVSPMVLPSSGVLVLNVESSVSHATALSYVAKASDYSDLQ